MRTSEILVFMVLVALLVFLLLLGLFAHLSIKEYLGVIASSVRQAANVIEDHYEPGQDSEEDEEAYDEASRRITLLGVLERARVNGIRFEVVVVDHGALALTASMRYRWAVLDADRGLRQDLGEQPDALGIGTPYMLGNSPSPSDARAEALDWIGGRGAAIVTKEVVNG